ncbi:MAG TPA: hypothetical protein VM866_09650 [Pyrinomonadaceae bacterium]|jgi:hypothetical protein|nr:hypothetical protein [Pyrinomonadaceae bacterium]
MWATLLRRQLVGLRHQPVKEAVGLRYASSFIQPVKFIRSERRDGSDKLISVARQIGLERPRKMNHDANGKGYPCRHEA